MPHPGNALPGGSDMSALPPEAASLRGEAIVRWKNDRAAAKQLWDLPAGLEHGPADGTVAHIEGQLKVALVVVYG